MDANILAQSYQTKIEAIDRSYCTICCSCGRYEDYCHGLFIFQCLNCCSRGIVITPSYEKACQLAKEIYDSICKVCDIHAVQQHTYEFQTYEHISELINEYNRYVARRPNKIPHESVNRLHRNTTAFRNHLTSAFALRYYDLVIHGCQTVSPNLSANSINISIPALPDCDQSICPICHETENPNTLLLCGHRFCQPCISQYRKTCMNCPMCRVESLHTISIV